MVNEQTTESAPDPTTAVPGRIRVTLRRDLAVYHRTSGGQNICVIEDTATGHFYRFSPAEYTLISLFDGQHSIDQAVAETSAALGKDALTGEEAIDLAHWLVENQLAGTSSSGCIERIRRRSEREQNRELTQRLNPLAVRIPLGHPDALVQWLEKKVGWLMSWPLLAVWLMIVLAGLIVLGRNWYRFTEGVPDVFSVSSGVWLAVTWLLLKSCHELAHAVCSRKFGAEVREAGITFIVLIPLPWVDVTSAWRIESRYQRILISAAGMMLELLIAAIAVFVWVQSGPGLINQHARNVILSAGITTLLFNINPLMKFDGYYMLSDWLDIPNLSIRGRQYVRGVARQLFFGLHYQPERDSTLRNLLIRAYGVAALLWQIVLTISLILAAAAILPGLGLAFAAAGTIFWVGIPAFQLFRRLIPGNRNESPNRLRFAVVLTLLCAVLYGAGTLIPGPGTVTAPVLIEYDGLSVVRTKAPGFVDQVLVRPGQAVEAGQILATLTNPDLRLKLALIQSQIARTRIHARICLQQENVSAYQTLTRQLAALQQKEQLLLADLKSLQAVAEASGIILNSDVASLAGTFLSRGQKLFDIGRPDSKRAIALVHQNDAKAIRSAGNCATHDVHIQGSWHRPIAVSISRIPSRATMNLPDERFALAAGGELPVVRLPVSDADAPDTIRQRLTEPRVAVELKLDRKTSRRLPAGQCGQLRLFCHQPTLGTYCLNELSKWISVRTRQDHGI